MSDLTSLPYQPSFPPGYAPQIAIIGCGNIVRQAYLPAYQKYGVKVAGVYDSYLPAAQTAQQQLGSGVIYPSLEALLADPVVTIVDIAAFPEQRPDLLVDHLPAAIQR